MDGEAGVVGLGVAVWVGLGVAVWVGLGVGVSVGQSVGRYFWVSVVGQLVLGSPPPTA